MVAGLRKLQKTLIITECLDFVCLVILWFLNDNWWSKRALENSNMVILSSMFPLEGTLQGSSSSSESSTGRNHHWPDALKCYVCDDYFNRPRILPCGHTFCAPCLARLRTVAQQEFNKSRDRNAHRRGDSGFFTCPWPNCHYSMKIMNLGRWSLKNRTVSMAVSMIKRQEKEKQVCFQQSSFTRPLFSIYI